MKIRTNISFAFTSIILFTSCDKDPIDTFGPNQINFQDPKAGQENFYTYHSGTCGELEPTGDTLIVRIKSFDGDNLEMEEIYTEGSPAYSPTPYVYPARWTKDFLDIKPEFRQGSSLFFFYGADSIKLNMAPTISLLQNSCQVLFNQEVFRGDYIGLIPRFTIGDLEYRQKKVVSCVPGIMNLDGYLIFDNRNLYSSFTSFITDWPPQPGAMIRVFTLVDINQ